MTKKIIYIVSEVEKSLHFEWVASALMNKYELKFILIGASDSKLELYLRNLKLGVYQLPYQSKKDIFRTFISTISILFRERPDILHTHLWVATCVGQVAGWMLRIRKRILTRHHSMLQHRDYPSGVKWDMFCNTLATDIVAISLNVKEVLVSLEHVSPKKITLIPHGIDVKYFENVPTLRSRELKDRYNIRDDYAPVIGVISRYIELKGIQFIIPAFIEITKRYPDAHLILANATGNFSSVIKSLLFKIPGKYTEIPFEDDVAALYKLFDVFVHVPIDRVSEAFGQTYVEALASGVPSIFTLSGIASDFIEDEKNALVVDYRDSAGIADAIQRILDDKVLRERIIAGGKTSVGEVFSVHSMLEKLYKLYE